MPFSLATAQHAGEDAPTMPFSLGSSKPTGHDKEKHPMEAW